MGQVDDLGIFELPPALYGHVKLEAGAGIELSYDADHNSIIIAKAVAPKTNPGEITHAIVDSYNFAGVADHYPQQIHISGNVFAVVTMMPGGPGQVFTITIAADGAIGDAKIDFLEFEEGQAWTPTIIHISGDTYAIAYRDQDSHGKLITVSITEEGIIGESVIDSLEFDDERAHYPSIVQVDGDIYAIAYSGADIDGWVKTMYIGTDGNIGVDTISSFEFDETGCAASVMLKVASHVFAIFYQQHGGNGFVKTIYITDGGSIADSVLASYEFTVLFARVPDAIALTQGVFAIACIGPDQDGWLITVAISDAGDITEPYLDAAEFHQGTVNLPSICHLGGNVYAIAYKSTDGDGYLTTVLVETDGAITDPEADTYEFDEVGGGMPNIIKPHTDLVCIAYRASDLEGYMVTVVIDP